MCFEFCPSFKESSFKESSFKESSFKESSFKESRFILLLLLILSLQLCEIQPASAAYTVSSNLMRTTTTTKFWPPVDRLLEAGKKTKVEFEANFELGFWTFQCFFSASVFFFLMILKKTGLFQTWDWEISVENFHLLTLNLFNMY